MNFEDFNFRLNKWIKFFNNKSKDLINKDKSIDWSDLENLYLQVLKKRLEKTCNNCYNDAVIELQIINKKIFKDMQELRYKLVEGRVFDVSGRFWSSQSIDLSNEVAEKILKVYGKSAFSEIKEPIKEVEIETEKPVLEEQIADTEQVVEVPVKKKVVKTAKKRNK